METETDELSWLDEDEELSDEDQDSSDVDEAEAEGAEDAQEFAEEVTTEQLVEARGEEAKEHRGTFEKAEARAKELIELGEDRRPSESAELDQLNRDLPALKAQVEADEEAAEFWPLDDEGLEAETAGREEAYVEASAALKQAQAAAQGETPGSIPHRVAERKLREAREASMAALGQVVAVDREQERRVDAQARLRAEAEIQERREAESARKAHTDALNAQLGLTKENEEGEK